MLLKAGANIEAKDKGGRTPLMLASQNRHTEIVTMIEQEKRRRATAAALKIQNMVRKRQAKKQQSEIK
jgi:ankyrin repeat protein